MAPQGRGGGQKGQGGDRGQYRPGRAPSAVGHIVLGTTAWQDNDTETARHEWDLGFQLGGDSFPMVANNLAWLLAFYKPVDSTGR